MPPGNRWNGSFSSEELVMAVLKESSNEKTMLVRGFTSMKIRLWSRPEHVTGQNQKVRSMAFRWGSRTSSIPGICPPATVLRFMRHQPVNDSSCVSFLRNAGAVILGKPSLLNLPEKTGKTANPHNPEFTPVDLPAVLAAGVADFMVPWPLEPRPGVLSFGRHPICGVVGFQTDFRTSFGGGSQTAFPQP